MIVVTGGTGFLGAHLLLHLATASTVPIRAIYRSEASLAKNPTLKALPPNRIEWVQADVLDVPALEDAFMGAQHIYHCAGYVSFAPAHRAEMHRVNAQGTENVVNVALSEGVHKLVHASSVAAIGRVPNQGIITEKAIWEESPLNSEYAISKHRAEREVWRGIEEGLPAAIVNPSIILGPGPWGSGSPHLFAQVHKRLLAMPPGSTAFVDVRNVCEAMVHLMQSPITAQRFIISGENATYAHFFTLCAEALGIKPPTRTLPRTLAEAGWRANALLSAITRTTPFITQETISSAYGHSAYDAAKSIAELDMHYTPLQETVAWACKAFLQSLNA